MRWSVLVGSLSWLAVAACGGAASGGGDPKAPPAAGSPRGQRVSGDPIAGTPAYDASGTKHACTPPKPSCPDATGANVDFKDRCRLAGYRVMQCGCDELCTGNVAKSSLVYDETNSGKTCEPEDKTCTPPDTSAAFQDACSESGHRFVVCGCQWLCTGKLKKTVSKPTEEPQ